VSYFVVMRGHGPGWAEGLPMRKQDAWPAHAAFMDQLVSEAFVVLGVACHEVVTSGFGGAG